MRGIFYYNSNKGPQKIVWVIIKAPKLRGLQIWGEASTWFQVTTFP